MIEAISDLLSSIKQTSPVVFTGAAIACGIILFGQEKFLSQLGLLEFRDIYKSHIGATFIFSISLVSSQAVVALYKYIRKRLSWSLNSKRRIESLSKLTPDEKAYLVPFIHEQKTTQYFLMDDGVKGSLEAKNILHRASNMGDLVNGWPYILHPWAKEHLEMNPNLLDGFNQNARKHSRW
jgi:hypothetical protein